MHKQFAITGMLLLLASCREDAPDDPAPTQAPAASPSATATATPRPSGARSVREETDDFLFEYSYPAEVGNIPELAAYFDRRLDRTRVNLSRSAAQSREAASDDGFPFNKHFNGVEWKLVADTPRYLSLSAELSSYSGGAHGNYGSDSLIWDRQRAIALEPAAFFASAGALDEALGERLCEALNAERAVRREQPVDPDSDEMFDQCVDIAETTIMMGSRSGEKFDRIGIEIDPYVGGPYAEGAYEFTFDVDEAVLGAVASEYREAFAARN